MVRWALLEKAELPLTAHSPPFSRKAGFSSLHAIRCLKKTWGEVSTWEDSLHRSREMRNLPQGCTAPSFSWDLLGGSQT